MFGDIARQLVIRVIMCTPHSVSPSLRFSHVIRLFVILHLFPASGVSFYSFYGAWLRSSWYIFS